MSARRKFCSGGGGEPKKGLPHAEKLAKNILLKYSYIYLLQKKFSENIIQNAPNYTINKHSGEYAPMYP